MPKGTSFPVFSEMGPKIRLPKSAPRKMVSSTPGGPRKAPTIAIILMSPPPMAGLRKTASPRTATTQRRPKPRSAPRNDFSGSIPPGAKESARPITSPPQVNWSGMM